MISSVKTLILHLYKTITQMNLKRIFGSILTVLGVIALIYAAILFVNSPVQGAHSVKVLFTFGTLGLLFFISGISLVRMTSDEVK